MFKKGDHFSESQSFLMDRAADLAGANGMTIEGAMTLLMWEDLLRVRHALQEEGIIPEVLIGEGGEMLQ